MRSFKLATFLFLLCQPLLAANLWGEESKSDQDTVDLVYQGITDLTLLRDDVLKRYTLMVTGESHKSYDASIKSRVPLRINRIYDLQARLKSKSFKYVASGAVLGVEQTNRPYECQFWRELLQCGLVMKANYGSASARGYKVRQKDETTKNFLEKNLVESIGFDPFDDLVLHPMFLRNPMNQYGWIERIFFTKSKLLSAETITQGDIRSKWQLNEPYGNFDIELTQSKAYGYLPTHVKYTSTSKEHPNLYGETEIKWKKHTGSGKYLPYVINAAAGGLFTGLTKEQHNWVFDWRLGKEIPDDFFDCESEDFRLQFSPLYDFHFDTFAKPGGYLAGTPWKTPEEILPKDEPTN